MSSEREGRSLAEFGDRERAAPRVAGGLASTQGGGGTISRMGTRLPGWRHGWCAWPALGHGQSAARRPRRFSGTPLRQPGYLPPSSSAVANGAAQIPTVGPQTCAAFGFTSAVGTIPWRAGVRSCGTPAAASPWLISLWRRRGLGLILGLRVRFWKR